MKPAQSAARSAGARKRKQYVVKPPKRIGKKTKTVHGSSSSSSSSGPEKHYEVDRILGHALSDPASHRGTAATLLYKVQWVGYPGEDTWEPAASFDGNKKMLRQYRLRAGLE